MPSDHFAFNYERLCNMTWGGDIEHDYYNAIWTVLWQKKSKAPIPNADRMDAMIQWLEFKETCDDL